MSGLESGMPSGIVPAVARKEVEVLGMVDEVVITVVVTTFRELRRWARSGPENSNSIMRPAAVPRRPYTNLLLLISFLPGWHASLSLIQAVAIAISRCSDTSVKQGSAWE